MCSKYRALFAGLCFAGLCSSPRAGVLHQNKLLGDVSVFFILLCLEECQIFFFSFTHSEKVIRAPGFTKHNELASSKKEPFL